MDRHTDAVLSAAEDVVDDELERLLVEQLRAAIACVEALVARLEA